MDDKSAQISGLARAESLYFLGVADLDVRSDFARFSAWLDKGRHAGMEFLLRHGELREDPRRLAVGVDRALVFALPYDQGVRWSGTSSESPRVAQYALLRDYHKVLRRKLAVIYDRLVAALQLDSHQYVSRIAVDSAPVLERALAAQSGRGFIGKNTCYIDPERGSLFVLGEILTNLPLASSSVEKPDPATRTAAGGCGSCRRCQIKCPTGALDQAFELDANKCLSYWTIEHRGPIPFEFWPWIGSYYFGCDICQLVCPYNRQSDPSQTPAELINRNVPSDLYDVAVMGQAAYEAFFGGTPMTRAKREGLQRNALIAMTVTSHARLQEALAALASDESALVQETRRQCREWLSAKT